MSDKFARFTFNQSAERRFLSNSAGLRVKLDVTGIFFHPTMTEDGPQIIRLESSTIGKMVDIDSAETYAKRVMQLLQNTGYSSREPFFLLTEGSSKGWLAVTHYPFDKAPPKSTPYFRVWPLRWAPDVEPQLNGFDLRSWSNTRQMVLGACAILQEYQMSNKVGRPPKQVQDAKTIMGSLNQLLGEVAKTTKQRPEICTQNICNSCGQSFSRYVCVPNTV